MSVFTHDNHPERLFELSQPRNGPKQYREIDWFRQPLHDWKNVTTYGLYARSKFRFLHP